MLSFLGLTGYTTPSKPDPIRFLKIRYPAEPTLSLAPITAILFGLNTLSRYSTPVLTASFFYIYEVDVGILNDVN